MKESKNLLASKPMLMAGQASCLSDAERKAKIADLEKAVSRYVKWIFNINPLK